MQSAPILKRNPFGARPQASRLPARARVLTATASMKPCPKHTGACSAYMPDSFELEGAESGPLKGLTFAAKDLYDVKGHVTSFGSPYWAETHKSAVTTAPAIQVLLDAGAKMVGKAQLNQLAYSFSGRNECYGTPVNPAAPDRIPGGSSSGSAAAVAEGSADIALGSDTGGSVRVPASYCGIPGMRPTHGRVSMTGTCTLAPTYDTGGFFAKDVDVLQRAAAVLLDQTMRQPTQFKRLLIARDAMAVADADAREALQQVLGAPALRQEFGELAEVDMADGKTGSLGDWSEAQRRSSNYEIWREVGPWVEQHRPPFGDDVGPQLRRAFEITAEEAEAGRAQRIEITARMDELLGDGVALLLPAATSAAPRLSLSSEETDPIWKSLAKLTAAAGLARLPQVSLPVATVDGCPLGLSVIGPRGSDEDLLRLCARIMAALKPSAGVRAEV